MNYRQALAELADDVYLDTRSRVIGQPLFFSDIVWISTEDATGSVAGGTESASRFTPGRYAL